MLIGDTDLYLVRDRCGFFLWFFLHFLLLLFKVILSLQKGQYQKYYISKYA